MEEGFWEAVKNRRTYYSLSNKSLISDADIEKIVNEAVQHTPSPFNSQSARVLLLLKDEHLKFWQIVKDILKNDLPKESFMKSESKIDTSFASGYATILYFEDMDIVKGLQEKFPLYKDRFPVWSNHSNGMLQFIVWTALEMNGFGASLQHYNPIVDKEVKNAWQVPDSWSLLAQMPFGVPLDKPGEKDIYPLEKRVKVY